MGFLNLGKKDEYGRQRRIEHRGKYLRASRTGGVALRAQTKAAGLTLTGNTARGVRVSATPARNTQIALQNGRFILRGRYGSGPFRLNLSKTGLSVSARNALGSINITNPNRSSAKIAGIQVRGKNAAILQGIFGLFMLAYYLLRLALVVGLFAFQALLWLVGWVLRAGAAVPVWIREWRRRRRDAHLGRLADGIEAGNESIAEWPLDHWIAALLLAVGAWGRGESAAAVAPRYAGKIGGHDEEVGLASASGALRSAGETLDAVRGETASGVDGDLAVLVVIARRLRARLPVETLAEILLEVDETVLGDGPRTRLQDRMVEVFADWAGLRFEPAAEAGAPTRAESSADAASDERVDINAADFEALQALPYIGPERARAIMAMRPVRDVDDLRALDGVGPKRLAELRERVIVGRQGAG